jgi:hypothetical protein
MNAGDVAISAAGGSALAFAGCWVISLVRSVRLLDEDRAVEVRTVEHALTVSEGQSGLKDKEIIGLQEALAKRHPYDEELEAKVRVRVDMLGEPGRQALRWLLDATGAELGTIFAAGLEVGFRELISTVTPVQLVVRTGDSFEINPSLRLAVTNVLYPTIRPE